MNQILTFTKQDHPRLRITVDENYHYGVDHYQMTSK